MTLSNPDTTDSDINTSQVNQNTANFFTNVPLCQGVTLADLRIRLRNELSGYAPDTLISNDPANDVEMQFINDGVSVLWPHDYQIVMYSAKVTNPKVHRYILPDDCEHVFTVFQGDQDINNDTVNLTGLPHGECWKFDRSFIMAQTSTMLSGQPWLDQAYKALWVEPGHTDWIVARYARKWPELKDELSCIDPSPNRVNAIVFYAAYQYFVSQMQVNTESIRYRNYQSIAQQFYGYYQQLLVKDSKPLYIL